MAVGAGGAPVAWAAHDAAPPPIDDRYVISDVVGRGGMATVYRATDTTLNRAVAVKVLHPHLSREPAFVEQFLEMERRIARLFHPHLVTVYDAGVVDESCFVVMEYVAGGSLRDRLRESGPLPVREVVQVIAQTAEALQVLHDERIIHGDVKPDNILLDASGTAKLVDFGIAHLATTTGVINPERLGGTTPYLAPEQVQHGRTDYRSDLYALGLVAYELLAGRPAFRGDNWIAVATQRLEHDPDPLPRVRPDTPIELDYAISRAIARDPEDRFPSVDAFRRAWLGEPPARAVREHPTDGPTAVVPRPAPDTWTRPGVEAPPSGDGDVPGPPWRSGLGWRLDLGRVRARVRRPAVLLPILGVLAVVLLLSALALPRLLNPPRPVRVPALTGQSLEAARGAARQAGVELAAAEEASEAAPKGTILRQEPAANAAIQSDQPVRVVVSSGSPPVKVPDLGGRRLEDARRDLAAVGLGLGKVDQREVAGAPFGAIVEQAVRPGSDLGRGGTVDVVVGIGAAKSTPKLVDRSLGEAEAELEKLGLRLGQVRLQEAAGKRAGTVLAQDPAADIRLRQGESVALTIAVPPAPPATAPAARP